MIKKIQVEIPTTSGRLKTPRDSEIQECIDLAKRENVNVELFWHVYDEMPSTFVLPSSTIEDIREKIDYDTFAATKIYLENKSKKK